MKKSNKILVYIIFMTGILLQNSTVYSQCSALNVVGQFALPNRFEIQAPTATPNPFVCVTTGGGLCPATAGALTMPGMGVNQNNPSWELDVLCDPAVGTNTDVNVSCPTCTNPFTLGTDNTGYRIGGNMFLWHGGTTSDCYVGVGAAGGASAAVPGIFNTFVGTNSGFSLPSSLYNNPGALTFLGYGAGYSFQNGYENTYLGYLAGYNDVGSNSNTFVGAASGYSESGGSLNTFLGAYSGGSITTGSYDTYLGYNVAGSDVNGGFNTIIGFDAAFSMLGNYTAATVPGCYNTICGDENAYYLRYGKANSYYGKKAAYYNQNGNYNCMYGSHSGCPEYPTIPTAYSSDSESFYGTNTGANFHFGNTNVIMGFGEGENTGQTSRTSSSYNVFIGGNGLQGLTPGMINPGGDSNITIGYQADAYTGSSASPGIINNAIAIGASAIATSRDKLILGNNRQFTGIGLSNDASANLGPAWNLEICTENNPTYSLPGLGGGAYNALNTYGGSGFSGLKFRDLTSSSTPVDPNSLLWNQNNPYPNGILSLDGFGNVIYIPTSGTLGSCAKPTTLTNDADIDLNGYNLYFYGYGAGTTVNNVYIGAPTCPAPQPGKLTVFQTSGSSTTSTGLFVINTDGTNPSVAPYYGIYDVVPAGSQTNCVANIAGYFDANGTLPFVCSTNTITPIAPVDYALFTPPNGGGQNIGFAIGAPFTDPSQLLIVNSGILAIANYYPSDSILKKNVAPMKNGLDVIRKIQPVSYKYNGLAGIDTFGTHYGLIAQNLQRVAPYAVGSMTVRLDTSSTTRTPVLKIDQAAVMYTAINALKQVDSNETAHHKTDSAKIAKQQRTIDSLGNVLTNIQTCLATLCPGDGGHAPIRNNGGNDSSGTGSSSPSNVQNISLAGSFNEPILYQNTPNPFSTGTSINYFLPEGTMGAKMLFFDSYGKQLKSVDLSQTPGSPQASGNGTLNITPDNLQSGIYSYSLVVDNKVIDTKRMVLQK